MSDVISLEAGRPSTEVSEKAKRRKFSAEYKRRILREAEQCTEPGAIGALLRREGLYSSHLGKWREQARKGELAALTPKKRGPKAKPVDPRDRMIAEQQREVEKLKRRAERAEALVEVQKNYLRRRPLLLDEKLVPSTTTEARGRSGRKLFGDSYP